jgi:MFS family permease
MGALSDRIKERFDITDEGIGTLTSAYFFAAMVGPLAGGIAMQKWGPNITIIGANVIVTLGAMCQAIANGPDQLWLIYVGRLLLGFGGEITPFTTVEILGRLFPDYFGLMAGVRNLVQSLSGFLAFVLLPIWADAVGEGNDGTTFALWMCAVLGAVSIVACVVTYFSMEKENVSSEEQSDQRTVKKVIRGFAKATTPQLPGCRRWMLPTSFFFAVFGIKAQYFAPFSFTAFSNEIYSEKFGRSSSQASFLSGYISLVAGLLSPFMGELSDRIGMRSPCLTVGSLLSAVGFCVLASSAGGGAPVWIASTLFALQYGFGDTVAYISIRFIVGVNRAGIGYGIYGVFGNLIATLAPLIGGFILEGSDNGIDNVLWYFCGLMLIGTLCWVMVYILEGKRSLLELPAAQVIETSDEDLQMAALTYVISPPIQVDDTRE